MKITEAISILRAIDAEIDDVLANFEEPGKIDLVSYMEKNAAMQEYLVGWVREILRCFGFPANPIRHSNRLSKYVS